MELFSASLLFLIGLVLIVKGGDIFVDAAAWMARASGIPQFVIGATIVSLATTMPEVIVSALAAVDGSTDMALGNAVGSVSANIGLILAITLIFMPSAILRRQFAAKGLLMIFSCLALLFFCRNQALSTPEALGMFLLFSSFLAENLIAARSMSTNAAPTPRLRIRRRELIRNLAFFFVGAASLVIGSQLLVTNGEILAAALGVPTRIIAITLVAIGTSLPEFVTAITALVKRESSMSVGNILGANIIDLTMILPLCTLLSGGSLPVSTPNLTVDMPLTLALTCLAVLPTLALRRFTRWQGVLLLIFYLSYLIVSISA